MKGLDQFFCNDKALVILTVLVIVGMYMILNKPVDPSIVNSALAGLFGIAVGGSLKGGA